MNWCLLLIEDGRDEYHEASIASAKENLPDPTHVVEVHDGDHKLGFAGAIAEGWQKALATGADWVFHLEADFTFNARVPLERMARIIEGSDSHGPNPQGPRMAQVALKRQAWNEREKAAGGIIEADPEDFTEVHSACGIWTQHKKFFTTNPCLYPIELCKQGWPQEPNSEGVFTHRLIDQGYYFAFYGGREWPPFVNHIGTERLGTGY